MGKNSEGRVGVKIVSFQAAIVLGIVAGAGYTTMEHVLVTWQIDDPVGSFPVHYVGGFIGLVLTPVFANSEQPYSWVYWKGNQKSKNHISAEKF